MLTKIIFDTSGINALEDGGAESSPLMRKLAWDYDVILTFTNAEELISTPSPERREISYLPLRAAVEAREVHRSSSTDNQADDLSPCWWASTI